MKITVYATTTCPYCSQLKDFLSQKGLSFEEKLIDQNEAAKEEMKAVSGGFMGVPFVYIEKDDGAKESVIGFDMGKLNQILG
jgi:glutaredoxin 3